MAARSITPHRVDSDALQQRSVAKPHKRTFVHIAVQLNYMFNAKRFIEFSEVPGRRAVLDRR
jgi:hypothetical protein